MYDVYLLTYMHLYTLHLAYPLIYRTGYTASSEPLIYRNGYTASSVLFHGCFTGRFVVAKQIVQRFLRHLRHWERTTPICPKPALFNCAYLFVLWRLKFSLCVWPSCEYTYCHGGAGPWLGGKYTYCHGGAGPWLGGKYTYCHGGAGPWLGGKYTYWHGGAGPWLGGRIHLLACSHCAETYVHWTPCVQLVMSNLYTFDTMNVHTHTWCKSNWHVMVEYSLAWEFVQNLAKLQSSSSLVLRQYKRSRISETRSAITR